MGTTLVYSAALLLVAAIASCSDVAVSTSTTSTTPASIAEGDSTAKSKRGVVDTGTNIWANNGAYRSKPANPSTSSPIANYKSPLTSSSSSSNSPAYSPAKNDGRTSVYNNQKSGYQQASPYSSPSLAASVDKSYGNIGQTFGTTGPGYERAGEIFLSSPQNYGSADQGLNSGFTFYTPQSQGSQPATSSAQAQGSQAGHIQNGPINTPYYSSFASAPISMKAFAEKFQTEQSRASPFQIPFEQQNVQKTQSMYAPNHQSAAYFVPSLGSIPYQQSAALSQGSPYASQGGPVFSATSQIHGNSLKSNPPRQKGQEFVQTYAPHHQSASSFVPNFEPATVDFEGKKIPLPLLQLQSATDFPGFGQSINAQPLVLAANNEFGFLADFAKSINQPAGNILPFLNNQQFNEPQVLPVRSANGSPQFPQYKGASLNTAPNYNFATPGLYEPLNAQPQLHFTGEPAPLRPAPAPKSTSSVIHYPSSNTRPAGEIRDDAEVIKKKRPVPAPHDSDEDEEDEGYKAIEREYGRQQDDAEDEGHRGQNFKESDSEGDFKPSTSFPFKSYDEKFSKLTKSPSSDEDSDEDRPASYRYRGSSSADDDDDYDGHSSAHHADYRSPKARPSKYEDAAEESQTNERHEDGAEEDDEHESRPSAYSSYGKDFEQEFEDSYRRELPKSKYVHVKEVPEIDEPAASSHKSYSTPKPSKSSHRGKKIHPHSHSHGEEPEESRSYSTHSSQKHGKAPRNKDGEGYSASIRSYNKGHSPRVIHEDSFGYKTPEGDSYSKYKKSPSGDSYSAVKKSPKMDSYVKSSRSSYKAPKKDNAYENGDAYSYSSGSSWKSDKKAPESGSYHGHASTPVKSLVLPGSQSGSHAPTFPGGRFFDSSTGQMVRDLTGI